MSSRGRGNIDSRGGQACSAAAMSFVLHAASPRVPVFRADVRSMEVAGDGWFGGGADLTPYYLNNSDDGEAFHGLYNDISYRYERRHFAYPGNPELDLGTGGSSRRQTLIYPGLWRLPIPLDTAIRGKAIVKLWSSPGTGIRLMLEGDGGVQD